MDNGASSYRRFLNGDDSGIVDIVKDYKDGLILYINRYVENILIAEELAEDTFFKLMVKKPRFLPHYSFKTWLYTIGRNVAMDYIRKKRKIVFDTMENFEFLTREEDSLLQAYLREEKKQIVHKAIGKLKPEYREVLQLIYFEEFTNTETAQIMKKSKRQVEMLVYRAKKSLKTELLKEGFGYEEL
ncbi:MAG: RNA polymerase sigma factor [Lachnospiraceae bacterium]|nr:RNA polymerase sigma factor [Lachnospiraceae bacterium]